MIINNLSGAIGGLTDELRKHRSGVDSYFVDNCDSNQGDESGGYGDDVHSDDANDAQTSDDYHDDLEEIDDHEEHEDNHDDVCDSHDECDDED